MDVSITTDELKVVQLDRPYLAIPLPKGEPITKESLNGYYTITIKKSKRKRSLNANAYCWLLCEKIAKKITADGQFTSKETIYKWAVKTSGKFDYIALAENAKETFVLSWTSRGTGWICEEIGACEEIENGVILLLYYGTSSYTTDEMARVIDCLEMELMNIEGQC